MTLPAFLQSVMLLGAAAHQGQGASTTSHCQHEPAAAQSSQHSLHTATALSVSMVAHGKHNMTVSDCKDLVQYPITALGDWSHKVSRHTLLCHEVVVSWL